jgi:Domain of unknown function (DUF932)
MKTATGNEVRQPLSYFGKKVNSYAQACKAVGFSIISLPALCPPLIKKLSNRDTIPNTQDLFRSDNGECLGRHTEQFGFLQPDESLKTLERARELSGGEWQSVSAIKFGRQITAFCGLEAIIKAPKRGDKVGLSMAYFDHFDGGGFASLRLMANVLACDNGMVSQKAIIAFSGKHTGTLKDRFATMELKLHIRLQEEVEAMQGIVTKLDTTPMSLDEVKNFARTLYPAKDENDVPTRTQNMRDAIAVGFVRGTGNVGKTRWDAFNAVTEYLDWQSSFRETDFSREENRFESLTVGSGAKTRSEALELLLN